jgi:septum formation protein
MKRPQVILASASPRRKILLEATGLAFTIVASGSDETRHDHEDAVTYAVRVACEKALSVSRLHSEAIVIAADTIVELDGEILQKPADTADAARMLRKLSGATHTVVTAFAIAHGERIIERAPISARVTFHRLTPEAIDAYIATGEPFDKAGSYGIQAQGARFIAAVEGSRDTVMGLPVKELMVALQRIVANQ